MGKRIISQRRGRGTTTYKSPGFRFRGEVKHRAYDEIEKTSVINGRVSELIHCPGHFAPLAKVVYDNKETVLMCAPLGMRVNQAVSSGAKANPGIGNTIPLKDIPLGSDVFNIESFVGDGGKFIRSSGCSAKVISKTDEFILVKFPSKKEKKFNPNCRATIGIIGGAGRKEKPFVKAGKRYYAMKARNKLYPRTSAVKMNVVDHPFGSGRGKHIGQSKVPKRNAPPGRNVGLIRARRTGRRK